MKVLINSVAAGSLAGLLGAVVWAGIVYVTNYEVGWVAWGVGAIVGLAVRAVSKPKVTESGNAVEDAVSEMRQGLDQTAPGVLAAVVAIVAVAAGKYGAGAIALSRIASPDFADQELLISYVADEVIMERQAAGEQVSWPEGVVPAEAVAQSDYPAHIWSEAEARWNALSPAEREAFGESLMADYESMTSEMGAAVFISSFSPFDLLWFGLAAWTAFKIGASGSDD